MKIEAQHLRCPDCGGQIDDAFTCRSCARLLVSDNAGIYDLRPLNMDSVKWNEDSVFAPDGVELAKTVDRPWRRIIGRLEVQRFDREIVDRFPIGRFLEVGGETCFASAIYKSVHPEAIVYGTDVSPNALRYAAIPSGRFFPRQPDILAAVDAEQMPFADNTFSAVFALTMMHHLPHPTRMLNEVYRVLAPGGLFIGVDHSVPPHFRWLFEGIAKTRAASHGIQEELVSYERWADIIDQSNIPATSLRLYRDPQYQYNAVFRLAGSVLARLPERLARYFPAGIIIEFQKS